MLEKILSSSGEKFFRISNASNKVWLMPARNMRVAMNLYQPSGAKGKLLKSFFPILYPASIIRKAIKAEEVSRSLQPELRELFSNIFKCDKLEFAIFCGTPCVHQKITIQIFRGNRILGYCKISDSEEIANLFTRESDILKKFCELGIDAIPQCLYCGKVLGINAFIQSTAKTSSSATIHNWSTYQEDFLKDLHNKTKQTLTFEDTDYYNTLMSLKSHLDWLPNCIKKDDVDRAIDVAISEYKGKQVEFSAYHADFTPWNMFIEKGKLFIFDWEYAQNTYPPTLDRYHFFMQTAIFEKHWESREIIDYINSHDGKWIDRKYFSFYILDTISRYTLREKGNVKGDVANSFKIWNALLKFLQK